MIQTFAFPSSLLLAVSSVLTVIVLHSCARRSRWVRWLATTRSALVLLFFGAATLAVEGTIAHPLHRTLPFVLYLLLLTLSLGLTSLNALAALRRQYGRRQLGLLLNHLGLFLIVWASLFGAPDVSRSKLQLFRGEAAGMSFTREGRVVPLPFTIALQDFQTEYYADGSRKPRQYRSTLLVDGRQMTTEVNAPCSHGGYTIYQDGCDMQGGTYSILQLVRDPWLPLVYAGMVLLALGALLLLIGHWRARVIVPALLTLAVLFTVFTVARIEFGTLVPALRSWWFVPHLMLYMLAYSLMFIALVTWLYEKRQGKDKVLSDQLVRSASALLILGMLTGSVWAQQAWGNCWAWDPKENWAAATWLVTLMHLHLSHRRAWTAFAILILAFLALQITWYGVNYLPSAAASLHTYNR